MMPSSHPKDHSRNRPRWKSMTDLTFMPAESIRGGDNPQAMPPLAVDTLDYNDEEATERTPMPHLYPSLDPMQLPMAAAAD